MPSAAASNLDQDGRKMLGWGESVSVAHHKQIHYMVKGKNMTKWWVGQWIAV